MTIECGRTYFWKKGGELKVFYRPKVCVFTKISIFYLISLQWWWYVCNDSKYCSYSSSSRQRVMVKLANLMLAQANTLVVIRGDTHIDTCFAASHVLRPLSPLCFLWWRDSNGAGASLMCWGIKSHLAMTAQKITTNNFLQLTSFFFFSASSSYRRWHHLHKILK